MKMAVFVNSIGVMFAVNPCNVSITEENDAHTRMRETNREDSFTSHLIQMPFVDVLTILNAAMKG